MIAAKAALKQFKDVVKSIYLIKRVRLRDFTRLGVTLSLGAGFDCTERRLLN